MIRLQATRFCATAAALAISLMTAHGQDEKPWEVPSNTWHFASALTMNPQAPDAYARLLFSDGKKKALSVSCDDGRAHDRQFVEILNKFGIRGTFNLNSTFLDKVGYVTRAEIKELYAGHEVSCHSASHKALTKITDEEIRAEIMGNRADLEALMGHPVRGLAYPSGDYDNRVANLLPGLGISYARCVGVTHGFKLPDDPYCWLTTCQFGGRWIDDATVFLAQNNAPALMLVWGHSFDFGHNNSWKALEKFCSTVGKREDVWYATSLEIADYLTAARGLQVSVSGTMWRNPNATPVWILISEKVYKIGAGEVLSIDKPPAGKK